MKFVLIHYVRAIHVNALKKNLVIVVKMSSKIVTTLLLLSVVFTTSGCSFIMKYLLLGN